MNDFAQGNNFRVISVNPSQKTVGAIKSDLLQSELLATVARRCRPQEINIRSMRLKTLINLFFGINKNVNEAFSGKLLFSRCAVSVALIGFAAFTAFSTPISWIALGLGIAFLLGFQTRIIASAATISLLFASLAKIYPEISLINASAFELYMGKMASAIPFSEIECLLTATIFAALSYFGPGRYSLDQIIRRSAFRAIKRSSIARKHRRAEQRLSYRAYFNA